MNDVPHFPPLALQTLAVQLGGLYQNLRGWLASAPLGLGADQAGQLDALAADLQRASVELAQAKPLLVVVLMGGTGVGKSSLLNALAGSQVAVASLTRPTTRDPIVYHHRDVGPERLPPELRRCRLVAHDRAALAQKIVVDTPDLDSNEPDNREKLQWILPLADVALYVGSQEKYHDQAGWQMFLEQKQRRAFAFVLNKWDRCLAGLESGLRPDDDLLRDLRACGFRQPLIFRTCAAAWVEADGHPPRLPPGEQFQELVRWLEAGLNRLEIEAIKSRGVGQLLGQMVQTLAAAKPPELHSAAVKARVAWEKTLADEADGMTDLLLATVDPFQRDIEKHFALHMHQHFRGLMAIVLGLAARLRYWSGSRSLPGPKLLPYKPDPHEIGAWDLGAFSRSCLELAHHRYLEARSKALPNRLLVLADQSGLPAATLAPWVETAAAAVETVHQTEAELARPTGPRRWLLELLVRIGEFLPLALLLLSSGWLLYDYFLAQPRRSFTWTDLLLPLVAIFFGLLILYVVIQLALPVRWLAVRGTLSKRLRQRIHSEVFDAFVQLPEKLAAQLADQRRRIEELEAQTRRLAASVSEREAPAPVAELFQDAEAEQLTGRGLQQRPA
jgi:hypothetical protein